MALQKVRSLRHAANDLFFAIWPSSEVLVYCRYTTAYRAYIDPKNFGCRDSSPVTDLVKIFFPVKTCAWNEIQLSMVLYCVNISPQPCLWLWILLSKGFRALAWL